MYHTATCTHWVGPLGLPANVEQLPGREMLPGRARVRLPTRRVSASHGEAGLRMARQQLCVSINGFSPNFQGPILVVP